MAECSGPNCDAEIVWAVTPEGKRQPFNREPDPAGNRIMLGRGPNEPPLAVPERWIALGTVGGNDEKQLVACLYMPHHATCPDRAKWSGAEPG